MAKNLVCLISNQLHPNYLFLKEFAEAKDNIYFITTNESDGKKEILWRVFKENKPECGKLQTVPLFGLEEKWTSMQARFSQFFRKGEEYLINLTGGTKYMAQAVYEYFRGCPNVKFIYIPYPKNEYLDYASDTATPLKSRLSCKEYFDLCDLTGSWEQGTFFKENPTYSYSLFNKFIQFSQRDMDLISLVRKVSNNESPWTVLADAGGFSDFLQKIEFPISKEQLAAMGRRVREKYLKYLAGTWFEEYVRLRLSEVLASPCYGIDNVKFSDAVKPNELDCVAVVNNHCLVGECKTYLEKSWLEGALDKANRINKNVISTLSAHSYLFYINSQDEKAIQMTLEQAQKEHLKLIKCFGKEYFTDKAKFMEMINKIKKDCGYSNVN